MIGAGSEVLGRHIVTMFGGEMDVEIIGVVDDLFTEIRYAEPLALYMPMAQRADPVVNRALVFRAASDVDAARREVVAAVRQLDSSIQLPAGLTLDERLPSSSGCSCSAALAGLPCFSPYWAPTCWRRPWP